MLSFPETFCSDPGLFDKAIDAMRAGSLASRSREQVEAQIRRETEQHYKQDISLEQEMAVSDLGTTYETFHRLRLEGRDTIWSYVARNLSRPLALATQGGWANVLVGNPPWVAYRHMSADLQKRFKELAKGERVYVGGKMATQNDLCGLFAVRASHLYLRPSGRLAFVMPLAVMTRGQFEKFRTGQFQSYNIAWDEAWTMDDTVTPLFPVPSCVVFGRKRAIGKIMPDTVRAYSGSLPMRDAPEAMADERLNVSEGMTAPIVGNFNDGSEYRSEFKQGAILVPRMLCLVERRSLGRIGSNPDAPAIESRRSSLEKSPWNEVPSITGQVEERFLRPVYLGESILPYRVLKTFEGAIPYEEGVGALKVGVLTAARIAAMNEDVRDKLSFDLIEKWLESAERVWEGNRSASTTVSLGEQLDYYGKLSAQFPIAPLRIVYAASGSLPAAAIVRDNRAVVEHALYWKSVSTDSEAHYLLALINSDALRKAVEQYQARGQFGARHFDKVLWNLPIPKFDPTSRLHRSLADAGKRAEESAKLVDLVEGEKFQRARKRVRDALIEAGIAKEIDKLVEKLLAVASSD